MDTSDTPSPSPSPSPPPSRSFFSKPSSLGALSKDHVARRSIGRSYSALILSAELETVDGDIRVRSQGLVADMMCEQVCFVVLQLFGFGLFLKGIFQIQLNLEF
jgi:hypothetical protein